MRCLTATHAGTGDHFGIGVSGYPEAHPDAIVEDKEQMEKNYWSDIKCASPPTLQQ
jgi:5,10-methylenetetrahydrofolate reductase